MHNKCKYDSDETGEGCPGDYNKFIFPKISFQNLALLKFKKNCIYVYVTYNLFGGIHMMNLYDMP